MTSYMFQAKVPMVLPHILLVYTGDKPGTAAHTPGIYWGQASRKIQSSPVSKRLRFS